MTFERILLLAGPWLLTATALAQTSTVAVSRDQVLATKPAAKPAAKPGFIVTPTEGFQLQFRANVQADSRFYLGDDEERASDTFILRRVRPSLDGRIFGFAGFRVMTDFGNGKVELLDAYADLEVHPALKFRVGKTKANFGLERLQSQTDLVFIERSQVNGLVPNRDLGAQLFGNVLDGAVHYSIGVWNGVPDGASGDLDAEDRKDYIARVFLKPFRLTGVKLLHEIGFGVAGSHGIRRGSVKAPGLPAYRTPAQQTAYAYDSDGTAANTAFANGALDRISPQASIYLGPVGLMAEYSRTRQEVNKAGAQSTLTHDAYQVTGSVVVTGEDARFNSVDVEHPASLTTGEWGALSSVRCDRANYSKAGIGTFAAVSKNYTRVDGYWGGFNWFLNNHLKLTGNFVYSALKGDEKLPKSEKAVFTQLQLSF